MVRRAAAQNLGKFVEVMEPNLANAELLPLFSRLTEDGKNAIQKFIRSFRSGFGSIVGG